MSLVEAIVYLIASGGHGLREEQITDMIMHEVCISVKMANLLLFSRFMPL